MKFQTACSPIGAPELKNIKESRTKFSLIKISLTFVGEFLVSVTKTHRGGAGTRRFSYSNHGSQSGTDSAVQAKNMIGCHDYGRTNGVFPHSDGVASRHALTCLCNGEEARLDLGDVQSDFKTVQFG